MSRLLVNLIILAVLVNFSISVPFRLGDNPCIGKRTCSECIQTESCAWCMKADFRGKPRCFQPGRADRVECPYNDIYNPDNFQDIIREAELTRRQLASGSSNVTQISPQHVQLSLRANAKHNLTISYSQSKDYPVDVYYLMDLSKFLKDDGNKKVSHFVDLLAPALQNITSDFRLGFGTFVNRVLMPNVSTVSKNTLQLCKVCDYGYHNIMPLSMETIRFATEVKNVAGKIKQCCNVFGNLDAPGDGFNAIMQAVVCQNEIKWRDQARRLLIFSTDAGYYFAGDGKLGNVITPNDGLCHLNSEGFYTHSTIQDYPSISQINLMVKQNAINVIFAVTASENDNYKKLSHHVEGSSCAILSDNSSTVVAIVEDEYNKISSSVEMKDSASSVVQISYFSACLGGGPLMTTNICDDLKVGDVVEFTADILVTQCPPMPSRWKQQFQIYPLGINEALTIDLNIFCGCPCEKEGIKESQFCDYHGTYQCGICECDPQFFGRQCECSSTDLENPSIGGCRATNDTLFDCNQRGTCVCGNCNCDKRADPIEIVRGKYCECDNFSCDRHNGVVCSGPANGVCECGVCRCFDGWTGATCECRSTTDTCITDGMEDICSGHGECICGKCLCFTADSGQYCENCPTCSDRCIKFNDCVQCQMYQTGPYNGEECLANCSTLFTLIEAEIIEVDVYQNEISCEFLDNDDCRYQFVYSETKPNTLTVRAQKERDCPSTILIIGIVLAIIVAIGLAIMLLWKLLTSLEFA